MKILSIDAWGNEENGYEWNQWYTIGEISKEEFEKLDSNQKVLYYMKNHDYICSSDEKDAMVEDDQYNMVIVDAQTKRPVFAIEYGMEY